MPRKRGESAKKVICGVYRLYWENNNYFYIGSSKSIYHRISVHFSNLKNGGHANDNLQLLFNEHGVPKYEILKICETKHLALEEEDQLIFNNKDNAHCCNIQLKQGFETTKRGRLKKMRMSIYKKQRVTVPEICIPLIKSIRETTVTEVKKRYSTRFTSEDFDEVISTFKGKYGVIEVLLDNVIWDLMWTSRSEHKKLEEWNWLWHIRLNDFKRMAKRGDVKIVPKENVAQFPKIPTPSIHFLSLKINKNV